ncbi:MAG: hypothetical protein AAGA46_09525, partial [Cyanobacteria bacterium P01_F01_bin.13]
SAEAHKTRIGKAGYVPPEQFQSGSVDATSDLYGLAATLVVLATGKEPQELYDIYESAWNWNRFIHLGEPLNQVLKKMLAPSTVQRYPSAVAVMQALQEDAAGQENSVVDIPPDIPPVYADDNGGSMASNDAEVYATEATQVVAPASEATTLTTPTAISPTRQDGKASLFQAFIGLLAVLGISSLLLVLLFGIGLRPRWPFRQQATDPNVPEETGNGLPPDEIVRKEELAQRRQSLGINEAWLNQWVNQRFYQQYANLRGRPLTAAVEDAPLRLRWDNLAMEALDTLQLHLSMPARRGLGAYGADDRESWRRLVNQRNVSSRALDDLTDAKFTTIFPQEPLDAILDQPIGQVWYALAQDNVEDLTAGKTLKPIEFAPGNFSQRLTGQLAPGQGQVFTLNLQEGQNLRINLQAPKDSILMSLYLPVPSQQEPFLLSDTSETTWSGRLTQTGFYEIAIASKFSNPLNYALSVAVDNIRNTPEPAESPDGAPPEETEPETPTPAPAPTPTPDNEAQPPAEADNTEDTTDGNGQDNTSDGVSF